jgi:hypothetical protein
MLSQELQSSRAMNGSPDTIRKHKDVISAPKEGNQ